MRAPLVAVLAAASLTATSAHADALGDVEAQQQALFDRVSPSVVVVTTAESLGSGFFVSRDGMILTNAHVVGRAHEVKVVTADGRQLVGEVVARASDDIDLALVRVVTSLPTALELAADGRLRVGQWVGAVGHGRGAIWSYNTGMVSNIWPDGLDRPVFQTQIPLNPGNSGGPVFDRRGRVVGVVTAGRADSSSLNFAIRSEVALRSFPALAAHCDCVTIDAPAGIPIFVEGRMVGLGPHLVLPAEHREYEISAVVGGARRLRHVRYPDQRTVDLR